MKSGLAWAFLPASTLLMETEMTTRRGFLGGLIAAGSVPAFSWAAVGNPSFVAAAKKGENYALFGLSELGEALFEVPLPARGHAGAGHPTHPIAVAFARRPGRFALIIDCLSGTANQSLTPPDGIAFNGHGCFTPDGKLLLTSEQLDASSEGIIGLWDVDAGYKRIGELPTFGIGPHDIKLLSNGAGFVVANGGIATDPTDRTKLNLETMASSLAYFSPDGRLIEKMVLAPEYFQSSIRHLAITPQGAVAFAMQLQADAPAPDPLVGVHVIGEEAQLFTADLASELAMQGYAGSIAASETEIAISSPKGNRIHRFDYEGSFIGAIEQSDVCGLIAIKNGFVASDGNGNMRTIIDGTKNNEVHLAASWDNHIVDLRV